MWVNWEITIRIPWKFKGGFNSLYWVYYHFHSFYFSPSSIIFYIEITFSKKKLKEYKSMQKNQAHNFILIASLLLYLLEVHCNSLSDPNSQYICYKSRKENSPLSVGNMWESELCVFYGTLRLCSINRTLLINKSKSIQYRRIIIKWIEKTSIWL